MRVILQLLPRIAEPLKTLTMCRNQEYPECTRQVTNFKGFGLNFRPDFVAHPFYKFNTPGCMQCPRDELIKSVQQMICGCGFKLNPSAAAGERSTGINNSFPRRQNQQRHVGGRLINGSSLLQNGASLNCTDHR